MKLTEAVSFLTMQLAQFPWGAAEHGEGEQQQALLCENYQQPACLYEGAEPNEGNLNS